MVSFTLFDGEKNIVFCSRDGIGKKPFFYAKGEDFIFSSEIHPIVSLLTSTTINQDAIDFFLTGRFIPSPLTIYNEIHKLPAGHNLTYDISTRKIVISKYYHLPKYNPEYDKKKLLEE
jgi:asparagine synthase (glutamine-hydrolysing)